MNGSGTMTDLEKMRLKNKIAKKLGTWSSSNDIDIFVSGFKVRYPETITYSDLTSYASERLKQASKEQLIKIAKELEIHFSNESKPSLKTPPKKKRKKLPLVKAFISHSIKNKAYANALKKSFTKYGIEAFVSGKDIKGGQPWQKKIRKEINEMEIFIAIHTDFFSVSLWCQQESGLALAREKDVEIIPIDSNMKKRPESFLSNFQYIDRKTKTTETVVKEILEILKDSEKTHDLYIARIDPKVKKLEKTAKAAKKNKVKPVSKIAEKPMNRLYEIVSDNSIKKIDVKAYTLTIEDLIRDSSMEVEPLVAILFKLGLFGNEVYHLPALQGRNHLDKFTVSARDKILEVYPLDMENRTEKIKEFYKEHRKDRKERFGR